MSPSMVRTTSAMGASSNRKELGAPSGGGTGLGGPLTLALAPVMRGSKTATGAGAGGGAGGRGLGGGRVFACRPYHGACQQGTGGNGQTLCEHGVMAHEFTTLGLGEIL